MIPYPSSRYVHITKLSVDFKRFFKRCSLLGENSARNFSKIWHQHCTNLSLISWFNIPDRNFVAENFFASSTICKTGSSPVYMMSKNILLLNITLFAANETRNRFGPFWILWHESQRAEISLNVSRISEGSLSGWALSIKLNNFWANGQKAFLCVFSRCGREYSMSWGTFIST